MPEAVEAKRAGCSIYQPFPEAAKRLPQAVRVPNSNEFPPNWEQSAITQFVESCINEQIIRLYVQLPKGREEVRVLGKQLLRSGTSVAAHTQAPSLSVAW